jgi:hypothetical protein
VSQTASPTGGTGQAEGPPGEQRAGAQTTSCGDAIKEQHGLRAFAQHGQADNHRQHIKRPSPGDHRVANLSSGRGQFAPVARHPDVVPAEHSDREEQNHRVQQFLTDPGGGRGDLGGEQGYEAGADDASRQTGRDPEPAARCAGARCQDDADDQRGLEYLTKYDNGCPEHRDRLPYFTTMWPRAVFGLKSPKNSYFPGFSGPI